MTGKVTTMYSCPRCRADISADKKPEKCPKCLFVFATKESELTKAFSWSKPPYHQLYELVQQDMEKFMDKPANEFVPGISKEDAQEMRVSNQTNT